MTTFFRIIKFAFQHFFRNIWLSLTTVSILVLTLLILDVLLVLNLATGAAISNVESRVDVSASFKVGTAADDVQSAAAYLQSLVEVKSVSVVTPEEALELFKIKHADNPTILASLDEVGGNPFGYQLVIRANSVDNYPMILEALDHPSFRDEIEEKDFTDHELLLNRLSEISYKARLFGSLIFAIFLLIAIMIILNTVRVAIFVHREEIAIMRLVGATGWFIRAPYLVEALIFSLSATIISAAIIVPVAIALDPLLTSYFETPAQLKDFFIGQSPLVFGLEFLAVAVVCLVSTTFAMRKHLRV
ncbi:MAG: permease-like cell division protein FtsX [Patescibacteria group bacterium]|jgi:cell division transport system permease protein